MTVKANGELGCFLEVTSLPDGLKCGFQRVPVNALLSVMVTGSMA